MSKAPLNAAKYEVLVVDDDAGIRDSLALVLKSGGYDATTAVNGFDALLQLKRRVPAIVLSDLNMPQMSGFELLSVVRRRFPQISVIAMSGAYHAEDSIPGGVIADAFYPKGHSDPETLLQIVAGLVQNFAERAVEPQETIGPSMDSPQWKRFTRHPLRGAHVHRLPAVISIEHNQGRRAENPGDAVPVLPQHGPVRDRFLPGNCFAPAGS